MTTVERNMRKDIQNGHLVKLWGGSSVTVISPVDEEGNFVGHDEVTNQVHTLSWIEAEYVICSFQFIMEGK